MANMAMQNQMDRKVHVDRKRLIKTLKANREKHAKDFADAMAGYKDVAMKKVEEAFKDLATVLEKRRKEVVEHVASFSPETTDKFTDTLTILQGISIPMKVPISYAGAYDAAIDMAEFDTRAELELSGAEFQCFCRDVWDWSYNFTRTTEMYKAVGGARH